MTKSDITKLSWKNPVIRAKRIVGMIAAWDDPLYSASRRIDVCKAGHDLNAENARRDKNETTCRLCYNMRMCEYGARRRKRKENKNE